MSKVAKPKKFALDIFAVLDQLNSGNLDLWDSLSEEEQKGFSPFIIARWMSGTSDPLQIMYLNEFVNPHIFNSVIGKRTEVMAMLLAICGTGNRRRFKWVAESKKGSKQSNMALDIVKEYYDYTSREAQSQLSLLSTEDIIQLAEELGYQPDELKKLKKELS